MMMSPVELSGTLVEIGIGVPGPGLGIGVAETDSGGAVAETSGSYTVMPILSVGDKPDVRREAVPERWVAAARRGGFTTTVTGTVGPAGCPAVGLAGALMVRTTDPPPEQPAMTANAPTGAPIEMNVDALCATNNDHENLFRPRSWEACSLLPFGVDFVQNRCTSFRPINKSEEGNNQSYGLMPIEVVVVGIANAIEAAPNPELVIELMSYL